MLAPWRKSYDQPRQHIKKQRHYFADQGPYNQAVVFPVVMYECELACKENWALKNWYFWTAKLQKTLESPLDCKEIQPAHPKGSQSWIFIESLILKLKLQYFGHLMLTHWKRHWCWKRSSSPSPPAFRGWDGWMASRTLWTWFWVNSGS